MSERSRRLRSTCQPSSATPSSPVENQSLTDSRHFRHTDNGHNSNNSDHNSNNTYNNSCKIHNPSYNDRSYSYPPLTTPLLVVSPTSPVSTPSRLPVVVARPNGKQAAPVIHCTSWLHPETDRQPADNEISSGTFSQIQKPEKTAIKSLFGTQQQAGFKGSRIPVRSARGTGSTNPTNSFGLVSDPLPRTTRSRSLTNLSIDSSSSSCVSGEHRHPTTQVSSPRSSYYRPFSPPLSSSSLQFQGQTGRQRSRGPPPGGSSSRPVLHRLYSSSSNLSSCSLQSLPNPSPRLVRRSCEEPLKASHDPYETSPYFTFHLTLRSPAKNPSRHNCRPTRCSNNNGNRYTEASHSATRCVEDMILKTCAVPSPEMLQSVRLPHSIHMPQVHSCEISIDGDCNIESELESGDVATPRMQEKVGEEEEEEAEEDDEKVEQEEEGKRKPGGPDPSAGVRNGDSINMSNIGRSNSAKSTGSVSSQATTVPSVFELGSIEDIHCISFGIVDYLSSTLKDSEHDETESNCSECGSGLGISPPTRLSDTDSTVEAVPVSSKVPLKGIQLPRISSLARKKADIRTLKWQSCQELIVKPAKRRILQKQLSDVSLRVSLQERNLQASSVEVYDGNVGVSVITIPRNSKNSSPILRKLSRRCMSAMEELSSEKWSPVSPQGLSRIRRHLFHEESGDSLDNGFDDSLAVEPSDTEYGEHMDIDDCTPPSLAPSTNQNMKKAVFKSQPELLADPEVDKVLGILEDDGTGPGLSEDEFNVADSPPPNCVNPNFRNVGIISPHKVLWYLQRESRRKSNEASWRQRRTPTSNAEQENHHVQFQTSEGQRNVSVSDTSQPTSAFSRKMRLCSDASQCDSSAEESDTGAELSELERCVLSLSHRRSQLRKQDTNAYLIAPPEFKIGETVPGVPEDPNS